MTAFVDAGSSISTQGTNLRSEFLLRLEPKLAAHIEDVQQTRANKLCRGTMSTVTELFGDELIEVILMGADPVGIFYDLPSPNAGSAERDCSQDRMFPRKVCTRHQIDAAVRKSLESNENLDDGSSDPSVQEHLTDGRNLVKSLTAALECMERVRLRESQGDSEVWAEYSYKGRELRRVVGYVFSENVAV
jgi:hypothetical protein